MRLIVLHLIICHFTFLLLLTLLLILYGNVAGISLLLTVGQILYLGYTAFVIAIFHGLKLSIVFSRNHWLNYLVLTSILSIVQFILLAYFNDINIGLYWQEYKDEAQSEQHSAGISITLVVSILQSVLISFVDHRIQKMTGNSTRKA
ncbi:MAG: hypothetical protein ACHQF2_00755 [Flavobacteriales bacterium]